ncbi:hypothetical protein H012_gp810 [Acanthamoeba polyphaga moumouvirus]|uniref:Uncharacterized protein n=1 Tax=Acanthamoeba polyphaga moumouvirus TaxID=1269028 RepID=L7RFQ1_9VIRU|nr:hypothetical protein H012_gp810 [Acanthamoeba polyphaga moumouvirus]AGC01655.1 hypothetical protein Moumou_00111 [Acanthamoeba polyphaga moumouvirus]
MLNYIACGNNNLLLMSEILKNGAMDLFGRKISMCDQGFISINDLFYIQPYDEYLSNKAMNNFITGILNNGGCDIKRMIDRKYCPNKNTDHKEIIMIALTIVKNIILTHLEYYLMNIILILI